MAEQEMEQEEGIEQAGQESEALDEEPAIEQEPESSSETDWKHESRKWERRAKASKKEADRATDLEAAKSEVEAELEQKAKELEAKTRELDRLKAASAVSEAKGVPASLLKGETQEEMEASADELLKFIESKKPKFPEDKGGSAGGVKTDPSEIKDQRVRLQARVQQIKSQS